MTSILLNNACYSLSTLRHCYLSCFLVCHSRAAPTTGFSHIFLFFQAVDGIRDADVTGVQTCALPIYIEFIVAQLLRLGKLGSFDFNSRFYADDDLIVGAADPFQLFRIMYEVIRGGGLDAGASGEIGRASCRERVEMAVGEGWCVEGVR